MIEIIKIKFSENYDLGEIIKVEVNNVGWNINYIFYTSLGKYFVKIFTLNEGNNNSIAEVEICNYLLEKNVPVSSFIKNKYNKYITSLNSSQSFHVQKFISGEIWAKNTATEWLIEQGGYFMSIIHRELVPFKLKVRNSIELLNNKQLHTDKINKLINCLRDMDITEDIELFIDDLVRRKNVINNSEFIDLSKLTFVNGHSDYSITQLITSNCKIVGIIDMTEVSSIPAIWEIIRFYLNSAQEKLDGKINILGLKQLIQNYMKICNLNFYDLDMLFNINHLYMCQAISVYYNFINTKDEKFLNRAKLRIQKIGNFEASKYEINNMLNEIYNSIL